MWLSRNYRASAVSSKTRLDGLTQSSPEQPLQHVTVVAVCLCVLLHLYMSLSLSLILILQKLVSYFTFPLNMVLECLPWNSSYASFIGFMGFITIKF